MKLDEYKYILETTQAKADYYQRVDFPRLSESFRQAASAIRSLIETIEKIEVSEETMEVEKESIEKTQNF